MINTKAPESMFIRVYQWLQLNRSGLAGAMQIKDVLTTDGHR
jgi:hypothetical protein